MAIIVSPKNADRILGVKDTKAAPVSFQPRKKIVSCCSGSFDTASLAGTSISNNGILIAAIGASAFNKITLKKFSIISHCLTASTTNTSYLTSVIHRSLTIPIANLTDGAISAGSSLNISKLFKIPTSGVTVNPTHSLSVLNRLNIQYLGRAVQAQHEIHEAESTELNIVLDSASLVGSNLTEMVGVVIKDNGQGLVFGAGVFRYYFTLHFEEEIL